MKCVSLCALTAAVLCAMMTAESAGQVPPTGDAERLAYPVDDSKAGTSDDDTPPPVPEPEIDEPAFFTLGNRKVFFGLDFGDNLSAFWFWHGLNNPFPELSAIRPIEGPGSDRAVSSNKSGFGAHLRF